MQADIDVAQLTPAQRRALRSTSRQVLMSGGFGSGKTTALAIKMLQLKAENPNVPGLVLAPTWGVLWSTTVRRLISLLRISGFSYNIRDRSGECYLDLGDGQPIFLRSAKKPETFDGLDVGWMVGDECRHWGRHAYDVGIGRVRVPCPLPQSAFFSTPSMGWLSDEFDAGKPGRELIVAPTKENAKNLAPGFIENLRLSYSPRLQRAVIDGAFTVLEGSVYEAFDGSSTSPWLVDYNPAKFPQRRTYLWLDPGYRRSAWIFVHKVSDAEWVCFDELILDDCSDSAAVERVNAKGYQIDEIWTDPAADNVQSIVGFDTLQMLRKIKVRSVRAIRTIVDPWRSISWGVDKVRTMLGGEGMPMRLFFARSLIEKERRLPRGLIKDLTAYRYPEVKDGKAVTDQPLKDGLHDHFNDALRYGVAGLWLSTPALRSLDPALRTQSQGWKIAA